ncbi:MAG: hypothetical protein KKH52_01765 [Nanoarchaeota archaeon]|nr:hypothetical protein [Nanoarchaeota archaeon]
MDREIVEKELKKNQAGYTVSELSTKLKVSRHTISNIFAFLEGAKKISIRQAGMAKIYYWKGKS